MGFLFFVCFLWAVSNVACQIVSMNSCSIQCSQGDSSFTGTGNLGIPAGRPGKRGPVGPNGPVGQKGEMGTKGDAGSSCVCLDQRELVQKVNELESLITRIKAPESCKEVVPRHEGDTGGVYTLYPNSLNGKGVEVYCDLTTDGGGWTVIQRRSDGSENFNRGWKDYTGGFGDKNDEFWLGLKHIRRLMGNKTYELRFDLEDFENVKKFAKYSSFSIKSSTENFAVTSAGYSGDAGNDFILSNIPFTTLDKDNDTYGTNCAILFKGGWWFTACHSTNINGFYHGGPHKSYADGVTWQQWKGYYYSLKFTEMKIREY